MDFDKYQELASFTAAVQRTDAEELACSAMGLTGEAGEYCDHIKKHLFHGHDLDKEHLVKELGDVLWYISYAATALGLSLNDIAEKNIKKLKDRYPKGFNFEDSKARKDTTR